MTQRNSDTKADVIQYEQIKPINLSGVPENEVFSEEIDTIFYDKLGIKNVRFKQTF